MKTVTPQDYDGCDVKQYGVVLKIDEGKVLDATSLTPPRST